MPQSPTRRPRAGRAILRTRLAGCLVLAMFTGGVWAQAAGAASAAGAEISASDRAKRDADKVFQWIRIHSDKPRKAATAMPPAAAPVATVAARPVARPAGRSGDGGITETVTPVVAVGSVAATQPAEPAAAATPPAVADKPTDARVAALAPPAQPVEEDMALVPIRRTEPEFSGALMRSLRKGTVQVSFTVNPDGTVGKAEAVRSSHPRLKDAAVATVSQWRFQPLRHAQQAVVDLGFDLEQN
jgi:protein TonB